MENKHSGLTKLNHHLRQDGYVLVVLVCLFVRPSDYLNVMNGFAQRNNRLDFGDDPD